MRIKPHRFSIQKPFVTFSDTLVLTDQMLAGINTIPYETRHKIDLNSIHCEVTDIGTLEITVSAPSAYIQALILQSVNQTIFNGKGIPGIEVVETAKLGDE